MKCDFIFYFLIELSRIALHRLSWTWPDIPTTGKRAALEARLPLEESSLNRDSGTSWLM